MENENQNENENVNVNANDTTTATKKPSQKAIITGIVAVVAVVAIVVAIVLLTGKKDVVGTWTLVEVSEGGQSYSTESLSLLGMTGTLELKADKTGTMTIFGTSTELTYDDNNLTVDGQSTPYSVSGNRLTIEASGSKMVFEKK